MASVMNVMESKGYCDEVYAELTEMKKKLIALKNRSVAKSPGVDIEGGMFGRQLGELADQIDWRLQILAHSCTVDWKGAGEFEETAQVDARVVSVDTEFSPGYVGG